MAPKPRALVTGVSGQDGSYLADLLLGNGYEVVGIERPTWWNHQSSATVDRAVTVLAEDFLHPGTARKVIEDIKPNEIYNLAAISSIAESVAQPELTYEFNAGVVVELLDAISASGLPIRFCQASSAEVFGNPLESPQTEVSPRSPAGPYALAKAAADRAVINARTSRQVFAASAILYNHESPRRGRQFVTRKITSAVAAIKCGLTDRLVLGDLDAKRDWGFAGDYVRAMWLMLQQDAADDFVIATGEAHAVREFVEIAFGHVGLDWRNYVRVDTDFVRPPEQVLRVGDASKARRVLGWSPTIGFAELVTMMVDADLARCGAETRPT